MKKIFYFIFSIFKKNYKMDDFINDFSSGTLSSCLVSIFNHPIDTIKVFKIYFLFLIFIIRQKYKMIKENIQI